MAQSPTAPHKLPPGHISYRPLTKADPFADFSNVVTLRVAQNMRQHTVMGTVSQTEPLFIRLDSGPNVPSPFVLRNITLAAGDRVLCGLISGGHDVVVLLNRGPATED